MNNYLKKAVLAGIFYFTAIISIQSQSKKLEKDSPKKVRDFFVSSLVKIGDPVLDALSKNQLKKLMPVEKSPGAWDDRKPRANTRSPAANLVDRLFENGLDSVNRVG